MVANSSHWVYAGTGLRDGDRIPGIVGYEVDLYDPHYPAPPQVRGTHLLLADSPVIDVAGESSHQNTSIYQAPSGAWVFAAGTMSWSEALDKPGVANRGIQQMTKNVLNRFVTMQE